MTDAELGGYVRRKLIAARVKRDRIHREVANLSFGRNPMIGKRDEAMVNLITECFADIAHAVGVQ